MKIYFPGTNSRNEFRIMHPEKNHENHESPSENESREKTNSCQK